MNASPATEPEAQFAAALDRVVNQGQRVVLTESGREALAVLPIEDFAYLQRLEDRADLDASRRSEAESEAGGEPNIRAEDLFGDLGL